MKKLVAGLVVGGRYMLVRPLAMGGMGSVWIARHRELDIDVTVKFMMPALVESVELRARFEREAKVAARLRSQHVVQVLDFGIDDETPYIAMELLRGESLADRLKRESRIALPVAVQIIGQVCKALRTAHDAGLVHRDLKPGNIFLAVKDGEQVVKVLDFGIVKETGKDDADEGNGATETGVTMGSVHYMSPEQIRSSRQVDHRSDLWSLAVILYKMLTGNVPFPGTNHGDVMVRVCTDSCPLPSSLAPDLPASIDAFFELALTRDPAGRFQSAQELAAAAAEAAFGTSTPSSAAMPPRQRWVKTLPLLGNEPVFNAAREMAGRTSGQLPRPPHLSMLSEGSIASMAPETAPATFQAVTMAPAYLVSPGSAIASPKSSLDIRLALVLGVALAVMLIGLVVGILVMLKSPDHDEAVQSAPTPSVVAAMPISAASIVPRIEPMPSSVSSRALPLPTRASTAAPLLPAKPATPTLTAPKPGPSPRMNPLDIND